MTCISPYASSNKIKKLLNIAKKAEQFLFLICNYIIWPDIVHFCRNILLGYLFLKG